MSKRIIIETDGKRYVAKEFVGPLEYFKKCIKVQDGLCCPICGCPRTWIPVKEIDPPHPTRIRELAELVSAELAKGSGTVTLPLETAAEVAHHLENGADVIERAMAERDTALVLGHPSIANRCDRILYGVDNNLTLASIKGLEELS